MVGESEKYCLPANMAKLRLTLHRMPWAFKFGICAPGTTGKACDIHFQQVVHLPPAVTPAGAVDRAR